MSFLFHSSSLLLLRVNVVHDKPVTVQFLDEFTVAVDGEKYSLPDACVPSNCFFEVDEQSPRRVSISLVAKTEWHEPLPPPSSSLVSDVAVASSTIESFLEECEAAIHSALLKPLFSLWSNVVMKNRYWLSWMIVVIIGCAVWGLASVTSEVGSFENSLFLLQKGIAVVFVFVWISCIIQIKGLCGTCGICPADLSKSATFRVLGGNSIDESLMLHCYAGMFCALLFGLNIFPSATIFVCTLLFRGVKLAGGVFFQLQFDNLLIETGWIAVLTFLSPLQWIRFSFDASPTFATRVGIWCLHFLLFRLLFASGVVKLASKDASWADCSALGYHYFSQPLPLRLGLELHRALPAVLHRASCAALFVAELGIPFLFFFAPFRGLAFVGVVALQVMILFTGHYGHFNVLTIVIGFSLLVGGGSQATLVAEQDFVLRLASAVWNPLASLVALCAVCVTLLASVAAFAQMGKQSAELTPPLNVLVATFPEFFKRIARYDIVHSYGLFATMTTTRKEVIIEGSNDGKEWLEYELPYKPGRVSLPIAWTVLPPLHLPRLDWRLWFCPLQAVPGDWALALQQRLLRGEKEVLKLFRVVPFDAAPKYIRFDLYQYEFASYEEERRRGKFWTRRKLGPFLSGTVLTLQK